MQCRVRRLPSSSRSNNRARGLWLAKRSPPTSRATKQSIQKLPHSSRRTFRFTLLSQTIPSPLNHCTIVLLQPTCHCHKLNPWTATTTSADVAFQPLHDEASATQTTSSYLSSNKSVNTKRSHRAIAANPTARVAPARLPLPLLRISRPRLSLTRLPTTR